MQMRSFWSGFVTVMAVFDIGCRPLEQLKEFFNRLGRF